MASKKPRKFKFDKVKAIKKFSREAFGRPGQGRKTSFVDRKKAANKNVCRTKEGNDEQG